MKRKLLTAAFVLLLCALVGLALGYWFTSYLPQKRVDDAYREQLDVYSSVRPDVLPKSDIGEFNNVDKFTDTRTKDSAEPADEQRESKTENASASSSAASQAASPQSLPAIAKAAALNDDSVGWIYIPGTNIDYPVMQADDNDYYLHNGADGKYNYELGCPFLDYRCSGDFSGFNSIIYAHYMTEGRMFADIAKYKEKDFMTAHPDGYLAAGDGVHEVTFLAFVSVSDNSALYHTAFVSPSDREDYIDYIFTVANYTSGETKQSLKQRKEEIHFLLLSTCTFEYEQARGVLVGVYQ